MFSELLVNVWSTFVDVIGGLADGLKEAFRALIYVPEEIAGDAGNWLQRITYTTEISPFVRFLFTIGGFGLAIGIIYGIFRLIRGVAHR